MEVIIVIISGVLLSVYIKPRVGTGESGIVLDDKPSKRDDNTLFGWLF